LPSNASPRPRCGSIPPAAAWPGDSSPAIGIRRIPAPSIEWRSPCADPEASPFPLVPRGQSGSRPLRSRYATPHLRVLGLQVHQQILLPLLKPNQLHPQILRSLRVGAFLLQFLVLTRVRGQNGLRHFQHRLASTSVPRPPRRRGRNRLNVSGGAGQTVHFAYDDGILALQFGASASSIINSVVN